MSYMVLRANFSKQTVRQTVRYTITKVRVRLGSRFSEKCPALGELTARLVLYSLPPSCPGQTDSGVGEAGY